MMKRALLPSASYWHWVLLILSLLAVVLHFAFRWSDLPPVGAANTADIPLLIVIAIGGIPLVLQILLKILHRDFGADLLAALALVTAAWLDEYLAAVLIIIMLSGGQALEVYAMRKASSVLLALAERMPSTAHRRRGEKVE
jgi:cation transport ATPase